MKIIVILGSMVGSLYSGNYRIRSRVEGVEAS